MNESSLIRARKDISSFNRSLRGLSFFRPWISKEDPPRSKDASCSVASGVGFDFLGTDFGVPEGVIENSFPDVFVTDDGVLL